MFYIHRLAGKTKGNQEFGRARLATQGILEEKNKKIFNACLDGWLGCLMGCLACLDGRTKTLIFHSLAQHAGFLHGWRSRVQTSSRKMKAIVRSISLPQSSFQRLMTTTIYCELHLSHWAVYSITQLWMNAFSPLWKRTHDSTSRTSQIIDSTACLSRLPVFGVQAELRCIKP